MSLSFGNPSRLLAAAICISLCGGIMAIAAGPTRDAFREIGGALVSGGVIAVIVLLFEEAAETRRESRADRREDDRMRRLEAAETLRPFISTLQETISETEAVATTLGSKPIDMEGFRGEDKVARLNWLSDRYDNLRAASTRAGYPDLAKTISELGFELTETALNYEDGDFSDTEQIAADAERTLAELLDASQHVRHHYDNAVRSTEP